MTAQDNSFQQLNPIQGSQSPTPVTMASATVVAPTTAFTRFTGTTPITTITPPISGYHELTFVFSTGTSSQLGTGGNIATAYTTITDRPVKVFYDPRTALYYVMTVA